MKYSIIKYLLGLLFIFSGFIVLRTDILHAQSNDTTDTTKTTSLSDKAIEIFTSNTCEFCKELEDELKKSYDSKSYVLNNIDTSAEAKKDYQIALVTCGKDKGTVPMFLHEATCVSGKEQILTVFKTVNSSNELKAAVSGDIEKATTIEQTVKDLSKIKPTDALAWYDYAIAGVLLVIFVIGLFLVIRLRNSQNKKFKLFGALVFFVALAGLSAFLWIKVNDVNTLSSTGADAAKSSKNCLTTNTCKDWNEFVKAQAQNSQTKDDKDKWESRIVDQNILDQQIAATNNALVTAMSDPKNAETYCGKGATSCSYAKFLQHISDTTDNTADYLKAVYGETYKDGNDKTATEIGGLVKQAIVDYNELQRVKAYEGYIKDRCTSAQESDGGDTSNCITTSQYNQTLARLRITCNDASQAETTSLGISSCSSATPQQLLTAFGFSLVVTDAYTGLGVYVPTSDLGFNPTTGQDECIVPTSGGACPQGTATCKCQSDPERYTCAAIGQSCYNTCIATHNVCVNCGDKERQPVTEEDITVDTPGAPICQESCSASNPCGDGTTCTNGRCENPSCIGESDCLCGTTEISCGDGLINNSDQAPEQCELGNPTGTSCNWDSCNQNTCKCPDSNPNWDIEKTSSLVCINNNTANAYAEVKYNISATYINESSPTTVGILDKVEDEPVNYLVDWLDPASISDGGTYTTSGNYVDKIIWDLTGSLSQFTIPSGETEVTKSDFLSYTFNIPKEYFGRYVNMVTGYPEEGNQVNHTNSIYVACNVPATALPANTLVKIVIGMFLIGTGLIFAYTQRGEGLALSLADSKIFTKASMLFVSKSKREEMKKEEFENDVLKRK